MAITFRMHARIQATVEEVLPNMGLAYLTDDSARGWAVTKSTPGSGLQALKPGQRVALTVEHHDDFSVVSEYGALD